MDEYISLYKNNLLVEAVAEEDEEEQEERELLASVLRHVSSTETADAIEDKARVMEKAVYLAQRLKRRLHELRVVGSVSNTHHQKPP